MTLYCIIMLFLRKKAAKMDSIQSIHEWATALFRLSAHYLSDTGGSSEGGYDSLLLQNFAASFDGSNRKTTVYRHDHFIGFLSVFDRSTGRNIIFGPALLIHVHNFSKSGYADRYPIPHSKRKAFYEYLEGLPTYDADEFLSMATYLHERINGTALERNDICVIDRNWKRNKAQPFLKAEPTPEADYEDYDELHRTQQRICCCIRDGNPEQLSLLFKKSDMSFHLGMISDVVENYKATASMAITLAMQAAVEGGLDYAIAMHTFDFFLFYLQRLTNIREVLDLTAAAQQEFAAKVERIKLPETYPPVLIKVILYIRRHLHEPLTAAEVVKKAHVSQSYTSKLFVKYTGMAIGEYIRTQKIEAAKRLLRQTDESIAEIAYHLSFSSQSHFQKVFKKCIGTTPNRYRQSID